MLLKKIYKFDFGERRFCLQNNPLVPDILEGAGEGIGMMGIGAGELFKSVGKIAEQLGKTVEWVTDHGPYGVYAAYLLAENKSIEGWRVLFMPDFPANLPIYGERGLSLPNMFDAKYVDAAGNFILEDYEKDWKIAWSGRMGLLQREILHIRSTDLGYVEAELADLDRNISLLEHSETDIVAFPRVEVEKKLAEIDQLLRETDPAPTEKRRLLRERHGLHMQLAGQNAEMDLSNQRWFVYENGARKLDPATGKCVTQRGVDLREKRRFLRHELDKHKAQIHLYVDQIKSITQNLDPDGKLKAESRKRRDEIRRNLDKAHHNEKRENP